MSILIDLVSLEGNDCLRFCSNVNYSVFINIIFGNDRTHFFKNCMNITVNPNFLTLLYFKFYFITLL